MVAERIMAALERPFVLLGQHEVFAHASIGSATASPATEAEAEDAAEDQELAVLQALERGEIGVDEAAERLDRSRR